MPLAEPTTTLTDYLLAAAGLGLGGALWRRGTREGQRSMRRWGAALLATGVSALVGGTFHGLRPVFSAAAQATLWRITYLAVGLASLLMLWGAVAAAVAPRDRGWLGAVLVLRFGLYAVLLALRRDLRYVVGDGLLTLAALLVFVAHGALRRRPYAGWIGAGVGASLLGVMAQRSVFALHPQFNHNDLFHVLLAVGLWLLFEGGRRLRDREGPGAG